jgi:hypothetical protein
MDRRIGPRIESGQRWKIWFAIDLRNSDGNGRRIWSAKAPHFFANERSVMVRGDVEPRRLKMSWDLERFINSNLCREREREIRVRLCPA